MFCEIRCFAGRMSIGLDVRSHLPDPSGPPVWSTLSRPDRPLFDRCAIARASSPRPFVETDFRPGLSAGKEREQPLVILFCCSALHHLHWKPPHQFSNVYIYCLLTRIVWVEDKTGRLRDRKCKKRGRPAEGADQANRVCPSNWWTKAAARLCAS